jgi:hypothetical protein
MAKLFLEQKWFAILRATRTPTARRPAPKQQPAPEHELETEYKTYDEEEEETAANAHKDEIPEFEIIDDAEPEITPEDAGDSDNAAPAPSKNDDKLARVTVVIKTDSNYVANKATNLATQARNATLDSRNSGN